MDAALGSPPGATYVGCPMQLLSSPAYTAPYIQIRPLTRTREEEYTWWIENLKLCRHFPSDFFTPAGESVGECTTASIPPSLACTWAVLRIKTSLSVTSPT